MLYSRPAFPAFGFTAALMSDQNELSQLLGRFRSSFVAVGVFSVCVNVLVLTLPLYMLSVFTRVLSSRSDDTLILLTVAATLALIVQGTLDFIRSRVMARVGTALDASLTPRVLESVVREAAGSARRNALPLRDAAELRVFLSGSGLFAVFDAPFVPLYVLVIYLMHPALGHLALAGSLILFSIAVINEQLTRKPLKAAMLAANKAQAKADDYVRNADVIEAMGMMPAVIHRWRTHNHESQTAMAQVADKVAGSTAFAKFTRMALQVGMYAIGAYLYIQNELLAGSMIAASILMARALAPVESAISHWKGLMSAKDAYGRLKTLLTPERSAALRNRTALPRPKGFLHLDKVVVMAPGSDRMILKGVSLALRPGEFLGVVGPSAAGKSTLAKVLVGILRPRGGVARLDGADLAAWQADDLGQYIGYLPQDVQLFAGTVRENIARMARENSAELVLQASMMAGVHDTILGLPDGYDTDIGETGALLSAGQRQHIALARALYGSPSLLVLDEPSSNLDSISEEALKRALATAKQAGITIVVVTHRPSILGPADKMLVLKAGTVEMYGPIAEVMPQMKQAALASDKRKRMAVVAAESK
jgi:PrtD family type I secretion system ABC transporter